MKTTAIVLCLVAFAYCGQLTTLRSKLAAASTSPRIAAGHAQWELVVPLIEKGVDILGKPVDAIFEWQAEQIKKFLNGAAGGYTAFKDKSRPITITILNDTPYSYTLKGMFLYHGSPYQHPSIGTRLPPKSAMTMFFANSDGLAFGGVTGRTWFVSNDAPEGETMLGVTFENPYGGKVKADARLFDGSSQYVTKSSSEELRTVMAYVWSHWLVTCMNDQTSTFNAGIQRKDLDGNPRILVELSKVAKGAPKIC